MELPSGFRIVLFSHPDYDQLTAEIYYHDDFVALVSQENGQFQIELDSPRSALRRKYALEAFREALDKAKDRLSER
jgi:hypothetical protein